MTKKNSDLLDWKSALSRDYHPINWASLFLQQAGFCLNTLMRNDPIKMVEDKGFRENENAEWYAAAIFRHYFGTALDMGEPPPDHLMKKFLLLTDPVRLSGSPEGKASGDKQTEAKQSE